MMNELNKLKFRGYEEYKDLTLKDYRILWKEQDDHAGMTLYQYRLAEIKHTPEGRKISFVERFLHHDLLKARKEAFQHFQELKKNLEGKYSIDKENDYDPGLGISRNYEILLMQTADASTKFTVGTTMNDTSISPGKEQEIFDKLKRLNPESDFLDNIIKPEGLKKMIDEVKIPNRKGIHTLKFPGGITMMINVT